MTAPEPRGKGVMRKVVGYNTKRHPDGSIRHIAVLSCGHEINVPHSSHFNRIECPICAEHAT